MLSSLGRVPRTTLGLSARASCARLAFWRMFFLRTTLEVCLREPARAGEDVENALAAILNIVGHKMSFRFAGRVG